MNQPIATPATTDRFTVRVGTMAETHAPFIELRDNLAVQEITLDLENALLIAAAITQSAVAMMRSAKQQARAKRQGIVGVNGRLMA